MDIQPFCGWRFASTDVSHHIAPPYDILDQNDKDELLGKHEHNIVAVDLPHVPPKDLGPEELYKESATLLEQWQKSGVLQQECEPALYLYEQSYTWAGETFARRAMLAGVRATPFGKDVIPHEHTFAGPKADRLKLTTTTKTQLSPIFGFYDDPIGVTEKLASVATDEPDLQGELRGVTEKLWVIKDKNVIGEIKQALNDVSIYIADGHHRYTTAMNYRDALRDAGLIDTDHEANYVLFALVARDDPGLLVLPTHRLVKGLSKDFSLEKLRKALSSFAWTKCPTLDVDLGNADAYLKPLGEHAMAFVCGEEMWAGRLTDPQAMLDVAPDHCQAWRELDVAILHELVLDRALEPWKTDDFEVSYTADGNAARDEGRRKDVSLAIIMQGTPLSAVEDVANAGEAMPHKSTYFYPKLATGMVIKPLE